MKLFLRYTVVMMVATTLAGCTSESSTTTSNASTQVPDVATVDGTAYLLDTEPEGAGNVIKVREEAGTDDDLLVVGRIGGSSDPWIDGRAAFTIVDLSVKSCNDTLDDKCPTPWDYCCETSKLPNSTALVKFVDETDQVVKADARTLFDLQELSTVVIKGTAKRDEAGNLTVLASGLFVKQK
ncbi:MAG: hypothetical protein ACR2N1_16020 [Rubripirellula sp.]